LEIDRFEKKLRFCPLLLDPETYTADTVDLTMDNDAREYWLQCLEDSLPKFTERAIKSQPEQPGMTGFTNYRHELCHVFFGLWYLFTAWYYFYANSQIWSLANILT
jgi:hypothetical protein